MTPPPAGTPWWAWLLAVVLVVGVPALTALAVAWVQRPVRKALARQEESLSRAATVAETIRHQVENDHTRNLRDDVDQLTTAVETVGAAVGKMSRGQRDTKTKLDKMHGVLIDTRDRLDEHLATATD
ncbi:hypothetical protein ACFWFR_00805 [Oerskovia sp. NPDC060287]|uniref:hypothetical protein n=1 Tax=Oerskovia sp. NPDC060287 TaxID=3347095 RepID=UPI00365A25F2